MFKMPSFGRKKAAPEPVLDASEFHDPDLGGPVPRATTPGVSGMIVAPPVSGPVPPSLAMPDTSASPPTVATPHGPASERARQPAVEPAPAPAASPVTVVAASAAPVETPVKKGRGLPKLKLPWFGKKKPTQVAESVPEAAGYHVSEQEPESVAKQSQVELPTHAAEPVVAVGTAAPVVARPAAEPPVETPSMQLVAPAAAVTATAVVAQSAAKKRRGLPRLKLPSFGKKKKNVGAGPREVTEASAVVEPAIAASVATAAAVPAQQVAQVPPVSPVTLPTAEPTYAAPQATPVAAPAAAPVTAPAPAAPTAPMLEPGAAPSISAAPSIAAPAPAPEAAVAMPAAPAIPVRAATPAPAPAPAPMPIPVAAAIQPAPASVPVPAQLVPVYSVRGNRADDTVATFAEIGGLLTPLLAALKDKGISTTIVPFDPRAAGAPDEPVASGVVFSVLVDPKDAKVAKKEVAKPRATSEEVVARRKARWWNLAVIAFVLLSCMLFEVVYWWNLLFRR
jgi:hypothetical protein